MDLKKSTLTNAPLQSLLDRMIKEENGLKKRLVESLEHSIKQCVRLSKVFHWARRGYWNLKKHSGVGDEVR